MAGRSRREARARRDGDVRDEVRVAEGRALWQRPWLLCLSAVGLAFLTYANSLGNGLVWDDPVILSRQLPVFKDLWTVLLPPANIPQFAPDYYRPLVIGTFLLDNGVGGGVPFWFHLTVVLGHCLATAAVFALGYELFRSDAQAAVRDLPPSHVAAAAIGAALFAVHPIHSEAVAWVAGRGDVLATLFATVAVTFHLRSRQRPSQSAVTGAAMLLALLAKEVAIALVILLPAVDLLTPERRTVAVVPRSARRRAASEATAETRWRRRQALRYGPAVAAIGLYAGLRAAAIGGRGDGVPARLPPIGETLAAFGVYLSKLVAPVHLNVYITELPDGYAVWAGSLAVIAVGIFSAVVAIRRGQGQIAAMLVWVAAGIGPSLAILIKIPDVPVAERYLYLPSVGFCLLVGWLATLGLARSSRAARIVLAGVLVVVLAAAAVSTATRNGVWADDMRLWTDAAASSPSAGMPLRSLAVSLTREGRVEEAVEKYELALQKYNNDSGLVTIYNNLGSIALNRGDLQAAEDYYRKALAVHAVPDCLFNLGVIFMTRAQRANERGDVDERRAHSEKALSFLQRAEKLSPFDPDIQAALGQIHTFLDHPGRARAAYERALRLGLTGITATQVRDILADSGR